MIRYNLAEPPLQAAYPNEAGRREVQPSSITLPVPTSTTVQGFRVTTRSQRASEPADIGGVVCHEPGNAAEIRG